MTKAELRIHILSVMFKENQEMRPKDIEQKLWDLKFKEVSKNRGSLHVNLWRALRSLEKDELIQRREVSHKDKRYSIKDRERVQVILAAAAAGLNLLMEPSSIKMSMVLKSKTYKEALEKFSKVLLDILFQRKKFTKYVHTHSLGPFIFAFPIPIPQEKGNVITDRILIIAPDDASSAKMRTFSKKQHDDLALYLTRAWRSYFAKREPSHENIVIVHFPKQKVERMKERVTLGEAESLNEFVHLATLAYLDKGKKKEFLITTSPIAKRAVEMGIYKNTREYIEDAFRKNDKILAKRIEA